MVSLVRVVIGALVVGALGAPAIGTAGDAPSIRLVAQLSGREVPAKVFISRAGRGTFVATLAGTTLTWHLTYSRLTSTAIAAHVRLGLRGKTGPVLYGLCSPCRSPATGVQKPVRKADLARLLAGDAYVNVETTANPTGEIRGQIKATR